MKNLFDPEGPVMVALGKLADLVICNILFILCSLPVITAGASLTALFNCTLEIAADTEESLIFRQFFRVFRRSFRRATLLWLTCLGCVLLLCLYSLAVNAMPTAYYRTYRVTLFLLLFLFLAGAQYIFPLQALYDLDVKATLKTAWLLSAAAFPVTLVALLLPAAAFWLSFLMNPNAFNVMLYLWAFAVIAVIAYLNSFLYRRAFRKLPETIRRL